MRNIGRPIRKLNNLTNRFIMPLLTVAVIFSFVLVALGSWNAWQISQSFKLKVTPEFQLQRLSDEIIYLDEVLTMSARMAASTGDLQWESRYRIFEPKLDTAIKQSIAIAPEAFANPAIQTDEANMKLVGMENEAFKLISQGNPEKALSVLFSSEYEKQKRIYSQGMLKTNAALQERVRSNLDFYGSTLSWSSLFSLFSLLILIVAWGTILVLVNQYINYRRLIEKKLLETQTKLENTNESLETSEAALRQKAEALEKTMKDLKQSQTQMVQNEKMSSLGLLVAGIAHEINNPVNFIHGNVQYIQEYSEDLFNFIHLYQKHYSEPVAEIQQALKSIDLNFLQVDLLKILKSIKIGSERINKIVLLLRNFSRMDEADFKKVDIHEGIDSTLLILDYYLKSKPACSHIEVIKKYGDLPLVECYAGSLNQVFMNILTNAIDALEETSFRSVNPNESNQLAQAQSGQIQIRTSLIDLDWVEIVIEDNGMGMSESVKDKIFDPFFTTKPVGKGTGMGMSISYQIVVEQHGGNIECVSILNQGTRFNIRIPLHQKMSQAEYIK
ncbi:MAG: two-component sensor histidine kinase [Pseudanabaena sp.]|nr:MAG: two-component sensor histidine kinase [Pseudanabaena sp.]